MGDSEAFETLGDQESPIDCTPGLSTDIHAFSRKIVSGMMFSRMPGIVYLVGVKVGLKKEEY